LELVKAQAPFIGKGDFGPRFQHNLSSTQVKLKFQAHLAHYRATFKVKIETINPPRVLEPRRK